MSLGRSCGFFICGTAKRELGEESDRKARPTCVVVRTLAVPGVVFLFPNTSQLPGAEWVSLAISQMECRRAGLDFPCWIILDECNRAELDKAFDFETTTPIGTFTALPFSRLSPAPSNRLAAALKLAGVARS